MKQSPTNDGQTFPNGNSVGSALALTNLKYSLQQVAKERQKVSIKAEGLFGDPYDVLQLNATANS